MVSPIGMGAAAGAAAHPARLETAGVDVRLDGQLHLATLRYFDPLGVFINDLRELLGGPLPDPLCMTRRTLAADTELILAWRSPTETWLIGGPQLLGAVEARAAPHTDGCVVNQTGGIAAVAVTGVRGADLLLRLGSTAGLPRAGEARASRLAELPVLALGLGPTEFLLLVERVYLRHLWGWLRESVADLGP